MVIVTANVSQNLSPQRNVVHCQLIRKPQRDVDQPVIRHKRLDAMGQTLLLHIALWRPTPLCN